MIYGRPSGKILFLYATLVVVCILLIAIHFSPNKFKDAVKFRTAVNLLALICTIGLGASWQLDNLKGNMGKYTSQDDVNHGVLGIEDFREELTQSETSSAIFSNRQQNYRLWVGPKGNFNMVPESIKQTPEEKAEEERRRAEYLKTHTKKFNPKTDTEVQQLFDDALIAHDKRMKGDINDKMNDIAYRAYENKIKELELQGYDIKSFPSAPMI